MTTLSITTGWDAVTTAVAAARAAVLAAAPDAATAEEGEAYVARILTSCLSDAFLGHLMSEDGLSRALPTRGGPNPDYRMMFAPLDPTRRYKLEGWLNDSERIGIGTYSFGASGGTDISAYTAIDASCVDKDGRFMLSLAADAEGPGGLPILAGARTVLIRVLHRSLVGQPARLTLTGGPPIRDLALAQGSAEAALVQVANGLTHSINTFLEWSEVTSAARNRFHAKTPDMKQSVQGDPDTIYFLGSYQLEQDEWLEVIMPAGIPGYWSLYAYNHWCEALPGAGVGDKGCVKDRDGRIRIAIGPSGQANAPNHIDTLGRRRGALICRIVGATSATVPETRMHGM